MPQRPVYSKIAWSQVWHGEELQPAVFRHSGECLKVRSVPPPSSLSQQARRLRTTPGEQDKTVIHSNDDAIVILQDKGPVIDPSKGRQRMQERRRWIIKTPESPAHVRFRFKWKIGAKKRIAPRITLVTEGDGSGHGPTREAPDSRVEEVYEVIAAMQ
jgi:hypothetical protein